MSKHTPGPWLYDDESEVISTDARLEGSKAEIAEVVTSYYGPFAAEQQANARLIAAAPDLLEALREADKCMSGLYDGSEVQARIRAAIAKATGKG